MRNVDRIIVPMVAAFAIAPVLAPFLGYSQTPEAKKSKKISRAKAENLARTFEQNASRYAIFDRHGKLLKYVGPRAVYGGATSFSPDGKQLAVVKLNFEQENRDVWVYDVDTGKETQVSFSGEREGGFMPAFSPDGKQIAYRALRKGSFGIYRKSATGQGEEELLYQAPGAPVFNSWSSDGSLLVLSTSDLGGGALSIVSLAGERKPVEVARSAKQLNNGSLSRDNRLLAYDSNETGRSEVYVRLREGGSGSSAGPWKVSEHGGSVPRWKGDGKELFYLTPDQAVMAVEVRTSPSVLFGKPKLVFRKPVDKYFVYSPTTGGERFTMLERPSRLRQITIYDRAGKVVKTVGEPGLYGDLSLSTDGSRAAVDRTDPKTGNLDIWTFDLTTGKGTPISNDVWPDFNPIWSADGKQIAYVSAREQYQGIYRKLSDGKGEEELLFRSTPGAGIGFSGWSPDGRFLAFSTGAISIVPLRPGEKALDRKALDWLRDEFDNFGGWFSPDQHSVAYLSDETDIDILDLYLRPFDTGKPDAAGPGPLKLSQNGVRGGVSWRRDGKEIFSVNRNMEVVSTQVEASPILRASASKVLFKLPGLNVDGVTHDGQRFVFLMSAGR